MPLPVALVLHDLPTELVLEFDVALSVPVGVPAVLQHVAPLPNGIQLPHLNLSFH